MNPDYFGLAPEKPDSYVRRHEREFPMITCYLEYQIDPYKRAEFREYAEMWLPLIKKFGGIHHGYFLPKESASDLAVALFSFESLAHYEQYRVNSKEDPECQAASKFANESRCIIRLNRQFLDPILPEPVTT